MLDQRFDRLPDDVRTRLYAVADARPRVSPASAALGLGLGVALAAPLHLSLKPQTYVLVSLLYKYLVSKRKQMKKKEVSGLVYYIVSGQGLSAFQQVFKSKRDH